MTLEATYGLLREFWVVWMVLLFVGIVIWAYWPKHKRRMEEHGRIPFKDEGEDG